MQRGRYYMGRVIKLGELNQERLLNAICKAPTIEVGEFEWTITDVVDNRNIENPYIFGNLSKYSRQGKVKIVDEVKKHQCNATAENLLEASAPFVYLPNFSGLAYLHVWNGIQENIFPRRFKSIIEAAYDRFFVDCTIEPLADYREFLHKINNLKKITELSAKVHPPNPLYGRLWGSLNDYITKRQADEISIKEKSEKASGLETNIQELIKKIIENPKYQPQKTVEVTDAAILMAADGYGSGKVTGLDARSHLVVIKTSDSKSSFLFNKEPEHDSLAKISKENFERLSDERDMRH
jgi:hypothetical protein